MDVQPSSYGWMHTKNIWHFYTLLALIPGSIIMTIINIRANPELTEIPEGYTPRHWEYYKHPLTRFIARYCFIPMETEHEMMMSLYDIHGEYRIMKSIQQNVDKVMSFYNDHRTRYFHPYYGDYFRVGRDDTYYGYYYQGSMPAHHFEPAFDPKVNPVPTEGYPSGPID